jgi:hypothetical protein
VLPIAARGVDTGGSGSSTSFIGARAGQHRSACRRPSNQRGRSPAGLHQSQRLHVVAGVVDSAPSRDRTDEAQPPAVSPGAGAGTRGRASDCSQVSAARVRAGEAVGAAWFFGARRSARARTAGCASSRPALHSPSARPSCASRKGGQHAPIAGRLLPRPRSSARRSARRRPRPGRGRTTGSALGGSPARHGPQPGKGRRHARETARTPRSGAAHARVGPGYRKLTPVAWCIYLPRGRVRTGSDETFSAAPQSRW